MSSEDTAQRMLSAISNGKIFHLFRFGHNSTQFQSTHLFALSLHTSCPFDKFSSAFFASQIHTLPFAISHSFRTLPIPLSLSLCFLRRFCYLSASTRPPFARTHLLSRSIFLLWLCFVVSKIKSRCKHTHTRTHVECIAFISHRHCECFFPHKFVYVFECAILRSERDRNLAANMKWNEIGGKIEFGATASESG